MKTEEGQPVPEPAEAESAFRIFRSSRRETIRKFEKAEISYEA